MYLKCIFLYQCNSLSSDDSHLYDLIVTVPNDQQTFMWVLSHGSQINVVEPMEWREKIHEHARGILNSST